MISLRISEDELFDLIMIVYSKPVDNDPEAARRRQVLLEKLHGAFETKAATAAR